MLLHKAIEFATLAHKDQLRKGSLVPYIVHPFEVAQILTRMEANENTIIAGLLHDTIEDCGITKAIIEKEFNEYVAMFVIGNTEDKTLSWEERKHHTIDNFENQYLEVQMICLADKLSNLISLKYDYDNIGDELWNRFKRGYDKQKWYYTELMNKFIGFSCYGEFKKVYESLFNK